MTTAAASNPSPATPFFVTGGALVPDAESYIERPADAVLLDLIRRGDYCYILDSRQMGKTSMMARAARQLRDDGFAVAIIDLTKCGSNVTPEQWYRTQLREIGDGLKLREELMDYWDGCDPGLSAINRFLGAFREFLLDQIPPPTRIVIFVDEIDYIRTVRKSFTTDEYFAGIRTLYNERSQYPDLGRLTFCLLGTATPSGLISNPDTTPFNIGKRIDLVDFDQEQVAPFAKGFDRLEPATAQVLVRRVLYWTGGQPFLTQSLCELAAKGGATKPRDVDRLCQECFLTRGKEQAVDEHYELISKRVLDDERWRLGALDIYSHLHSERRLRRIFGPVSFLFFDRTLVKEDETNKSITVLRLSGLVRVVDRRLAIRNEVYARRFDEAWIDQHLSDATARAKRNAFRQGMRFAAVALIAAFSTLSLAGALLSWARVTGEKERADAFARSAQQEKKIAQAQADELARQATELATQANDRAEQAKELARQVDRAEKAQKRAESSEQVAIDARKEAERQASLARAAEEVAKTEKASAQAATKLAERNAAEARQNATDLAAASAELERQAKEREAADQLEKARSAAQKALLSNDFSSRAGPLAELMPSVSALAGKGILLQPGMDAVRRLLLHSLALGSAETSGTVVAAGIADSVVVTFLRNGDLVCWSLSAPSIPFPPVMPCQVPMLSPAYPRVNLSRFAISADGKLALGAGERGTLVSIDLPSSRSAFTRLDDFPISGLSFSADDERVGVGSSSGWWRIYTREKISHPPSVFGQKLHRIAAGFRLTFALLFNRVPHHYPVQSLAMVSESKPGQAKDDLVSTLNEWGSGKLWSSRRKAVTRNQYDFGNVQAQAAHPRLPVIAVVRQNCVEIIGIGTVNSTRPCNDLPLLWNPFQSPTTLAWSGDGKRLAIGTDNGNIFLMKFDSQNLSLSSETIPMIPAHTASISALRWNQAGTRLFSAAEDHSIHWWDLAPDESFEALLTLLDEVAPSNPWVFGPGYDVIQAKDQGPVDKLLRLLEARIAKLKELDSNPTL